MESTTEIVDWLDASAAAGKLGSVRRGALNLVAATRPRRTGLREWLR